MRLSRSRLVASLSAGLALCLATTACGSSDDGSGSATPSADVVTDGTFTFSVADDPGALNPMLGSRTVAVNLFRFLYDPLVHADSNGKIVSGLASQWQVDGGKVTFTMKQGVTCSDGSPVTASTVAKMFNNIKNPANASTLIGIALPNNKFSVEADDTAGKVTLTLDQPYQFILPALEFMPIPCGAAADKPASLATTASGSGPYTLTEAVASDHYTLTRRDGYTWGPDGASTAAAGVPKTIVMKIVANETTAANLLTTGELNAAAVNGPDQKRLTASGMTAKAYKSGGAMMLFNEQDSRITADPNVRKAIALAMDRTQLASVVSRGLVKDPSNSVAPASPQACPDDAAGSAIPATNVEEAKKLLDTAGWVAGSGGVRSKGGKELNLNAPYLSTYAGNQPAAELLAQELQAVGIKLTLTPVTQGTLSTTLFSTGDYDIWPTLALSIPFQSGVFGLLGGPFPPNGTNAGHVANKTFTETATQANQTTGKEGCDLWIKAEQALFSNVDAIPIAPVITNWVTTKSSFSTMQGRIIPTSIRVTK
ncbi:ABC transporter substrate-binding protein [Dactylosporangium sp. CA-092794]|uniref:ABC transporter substrate-binding protein n=1 Tax=Dactylosporangium sp. CA-092794 TaxID=3239929 RepID=UPI003D935619